MPALKSTSKRRNEVWWNREEKWILAHLPLVFLIISPSYSFCLAHLLPVNSSDRPITIQTAVTEPVPDRHPPPPPPPPERVFYTLNACFTLHEQRHWTDLSVRAETRLLNVYSPLSPQCIDPWFLHRSRCVASCTRSCFPIQTANLIRFARRVNLKVHEMSSVLFSPPIFASSFFILSSSAHWARINLVSPSKLRSRSQLKVNRFSLLLHNWHQKLPTSIILWRKISERWGHVSIMILWLL